MTDNRSVLFYDGVCKFCNRTVNRLIRLDKTGRIAYSALQGELAKTVLTDRQRNDLDTAVYLRLGRLHFRSSAVIYALADASAWMRWVHVFRLIPVKWRDRLYSTFARKRYRWFGNYPTCIVPSERVRARFIP